MGKFATFHEMQQALLNSGRKWMFVGRYVNVPDELKGEDVYQMYVLFKDENAALDYIVKDIGITRLKAYHQLHKEDSLRNEFGKEKYLRSTACTNNTYVSELSNGMYLLWEEY